MKANGFDERRKLLLRARMNCLGGGRASYNLSQESNELNEDEDEDGIGVEEEGEDVSTISGIGGGNDITNNDRSERLCESERINNNKRSREQVLVDSATDRMGNTHQAVKNPWKVQANGERVGKGYTPAYLCSMDGCEKVSRVHCYQCNKVFCFSLTNDKEDNGSTDMLIGKKTSCFYKHVNQVRRKTNRR